MGISTKAGIKSIQRGTITASATESSITATIAAVNVAKSELRIGGVMSDNSSINYGSGRVSLTNSTTITLTRGGNSGYCSMSYEVTEWN